MQISTAPGQWEEDYFALPDRNCSVELSGGEVVMPPHPTFRHGEAPGT